MNILLDECLPRRLKYELPGYDVTTVPEMGWAGVKDKPLLQLAEPIFDVFLTADQNLQYQQNLQGTQLAIIILVAGNNRIETLQLLMPRVLVALQTIQAGTMLHIEAETHLPSK
jgi:predicted nuclease of predicted toxin-antitoxin system